jgi:putative transposase
MKHANTVFHQLLRVVPRHRFEEVVSRYDGDRRIRNLPCWTQFCVMLYAQLCSRQALRDVVSAWGSHASTHYHLGASQVKRSTLADANAKRPAGMYLEVFYWLLGQERSKGIRHKDAVRLIDSTTIDLCKQQFDWATFRAGKSGVKVHTVYDPDAQVPTFFSISAASRHDKKAAEHMPLLPGATYVFDRAYNDYAWFHDLSERDIRFVSRMKSNAGFEVVEALPVSETGVLEDQLIRLSSARGRKECPTTLRRIRFMREEDGKVLTFIANDLKRTAGEIADLYKQRWQIELFFKWIKQNLKIKRFIGTSENAVRTQIIIAMIAYLLLHMASKLLPTSQSMQQLARLVSVNLMQRRNLIELLTKPTPPPKRQSTVNQRQMCLINA